MKKINKTRKELSIPIKLLLILIFSCVFIIFGISNGFLINSFINGSLNEIVVNSIYTIITGIIYLVILLILIRDKDIDKTKSFKWYINCILISLIVNLIISAITIFTLGADKESSINYLIGFSMFPLIGIVSTINVVKHVNKDTVGWKQIFYKNGNIHKINNSKDYYRVNTPVEFEKKLLLSVYKNEFLNILVVIGGMLFIIFISIYHMINSNGYPSDLIEMRSERLFGTIFFLMIIFLAFGIPIVAYYLANAIKKIKVVRNHDYIAFHAIVSSVKNNKLSIYDKNKHYKYNYCTCVGIKEKDVNNTEAILIFIPDDVFLFPDNKIYNK